MHDAGAKAYLINTGWNGQGKRISLANTRALINAIFDGELDNAETETLPIFNLQMPKALAGLDSLVLDPRSSYDDPAEWEKRAHHLGGLFVDNFKKFTDTDAGKVLVAAGPQIS
jgi:phosphoenolpyruvate carboxykinase (ATP)